MLHHPRPPGEASTEIIAVSDTVHGVLPRPRVAGKFFLAGDEKLYIRGVTYGTFRPQRAGRDPAFPSPDVVARDLAQMAANGLNAVRVYSVPPPWLLDQAASQGLWVMVGIPWEQHIAFLDEPRRVRTIEERVRSGVEACAGHPAVLCYAVGNEIPPSIVRWVGYRRIERHIHRLYDIAKEVDPEGLVTYGNFPSTEYLDLPFLDVVCFNVYLEQADRLRQYLARLQNLAGERPLLLGEIGLDSRRNGEHGQARSLHEQVQRAFAGGCAGAFVFSWTDEWHRGDQDVRDWDFGLTDRGRVPKVALPIVRRAFAETPFAPATRWPRVSVVVCVYNGEETLEDCLDGLTALEYPDYEVVVVDDGSTDGSAQIAARYPCRLIRTPNRGLSAARNTGLAAASGEIVAYIDADARPDPHWLHYLCETLRDSEDDAERLREASRNNVVGVGGPNLPCRADGELAECVANAPGGPIHVLLSDREAEHIPGVNMAFRKEALEAIGGFDPTFRVAGDDVDVCWRIQARGWKLAFSPSAVVWHHQRKSLKDYWRQQRGYGRAEALLEAKWPEKYNSAGQVSWAGRIYAQPLLYALLKGSRVYHGTWGTAPFQSRHPRRDVLNSLAAAPEWYLVLSALAALSLLGWLWPPALLALPLLLLAAGASLWRAVRGSAMARFAEAAPSRRVFWRRRLWTAFFYLAQPAARLRGRFAHGLTPWRFRRISDLTFPWPRQVRIWSERWRDTADWLQTLEERLKRQRAVVLRGGPYDRWDLQVRDGACGVARLRMCIEEHGGGRQLVRFRVWPHPLAARLGWLLGGLPALLAVVAAVDGAWLAGGILALIAGIFVVQVGRQSGSTVALVLKQLRGERREDAMVLDDGRAPRVLRSGARAEAVR
ncbi:MAG: glycosyltransferase [Thermoanaerobaculia bacterium]